MATTNAIKLRELQETIRHNKEDEANKRELARIKGGELEQTQYRNEYQDPRRPYNAVNQGISHGTSLFGSLAKALNDFAWYTQYRDLVMNVLKQPIVAKAGVGTIRALNDLYYQADYPVLPGEYHINKNSVMYFEFVPSLGNCNGQQSPTSIAVRELFTKVRAANSGSTNYDAADLFQFPLAMDSIYYTLAWILRGICLVNFVNPREPFTVAYQLLQVHCFNDASLVQDFIYNKNDIISLYNSAISRINALNVPLELSFIKRHVFLTETVFYTGEHVGRSYYLVNPTIYYVYDEANSSLKQNDFYTNIKYVNLVNGIRRVLDQMIIPLELSQSISIMSGDIAKANFNCIKLPSIALGEGETMTPVLSSDIKYLQSFKNADIFHVNDMNELNINQGLDINNNPFLYQGTWNGALWMGPECASLNMDYYDASGTYHEAEPMINPQNAVDVLVDYYDENTISEEDQCYNFAFKYLLSRDGSTQHLSHSRSELIVTFKQYRFDMSTGSLITEIDQQSNVFNFGININATVSTSSGQLHQRCHAAILASMTDFIPRFYLNIPLTINGTDTNYCEVIWNRNRNRNFVKVEVAQDILDYTLRSMFCISSNSGASSNTGTKQPNNKGKNNKNKNKHKNKDKQNNPKVDVKEDKTNSKKN